MSGASLLAKFEAKYGLTDDTARPVEPVEAPPKMTAVKTEPVEAPPKILSAAEHEKADKAKLIELLTFGMSIREAMMKVMVDTSAGAESKQGASGSTPSSGPTPSSGASGTAAEGGASGPTPEGGAPDGDASVDKRTWLPQDPEKPAEGPLKLPDGIKPAVFTSKEDRAALWAKYQRTLHIGTSRPEYQQVRAKRTDKCPDHILSQIAGSHERLFYFNVWLHCGEKWGNVELFEEHYWMKRSIEEDSEAWLTDGEMMQIWHDRDIVDALKEWAGQQTDQVRVRAHPEIPHVQKAQQFKVQIEERFKKMTEDVARQGMRTTFDADSPGGEDIVRNTLARSNAAFGNSGLPAQAAPALEAGTAAQGITPQKRPAAAAEEAVEPTGGEHPEERKRRERPERFHQQETERAARAEKAKERKDQTAEARRIQIQRAKEDRQAHAKTPEGRAKVWLSGLQDHITKCEAEQKLRKAQDCPLPDGLAKEYAATWQSKIQSFKKARSTIEQVLKGTKEVKDFAGSIDKAETNVKSFKADMQRYKTLFRSYEKKKTNSEAEDDEDDV